MQQEGDAEEEELAESVNDETVDGDEDEGDNGLFQGGRFWGDGKIRKAAGRGVGLSFCRDHLPDARSDFRAAVGFFSLGAYRLIHNDIHKDVRISLLVGREQGEQAIKAIASESSTVVDDILSELAITTVSLTRVVEKLIDRIKDEKFVIRSAREMRLGSEGGTSRFHTKIYVVDNKVAWEGSANFTRNGFVPNGSVEQLTATRDPEDIAYWIDFHEEYSAQGTDLLQEFRQRLERWLAMHSPFDAYLKVLLCLFGENRFKTEFPAHEAAYYQEGELSELSTQSADTEAHLSSRLQD